MATSDPTWGELAMEGRVGVFGLWVGDQGGRRAEEVGCGLLWVGWCVGGWALRIEPALAGKLRGRIGLSRCARGRWCSLPMLVPARSADARSVLGRGLDRGSLKEGFVKSLFNGSGFEPWKEGGFGF